jgi:hypothetical protein
MYVTGSNSCEVWASLPVSDAMLAYRERICHVHMLQVLAGAYISACTELFQKDWLCASLNSPIGIALSASGTTLRPFFLKCVVPRCCGLCSVLVLLIDAFRNKHLVFKPSFCA